MSTVSFLQYREQRGMLLKQELLGIPSIHDDFLLYFKDSVLYGLDFKNIRSVEFLNHDKDIRGVITAAAISPSHKFAVAGFSDGGIQLYDVQTTKPMKVIGKPGERKSVLNVAFKEETSVLAVDSDGKVVRYDWKQGAFRISVEATTVLSSVDPRITKIYVPCVWINTADGNLKNVCPELSGLIAWSCAKRFVVMDLNDLKNDLLTLDCDDPIAAFSSVEKGEVKLVVAFGKQALVYRITRQMEVVNEYCFNLGFQAKNIGFLSQAVLVASDWFNDGTLGIMSISTGVVRQIDSQYKDFLCIGTNSIFFRDDMKVFKGTLLTFVNRMKQLKLEHKLEKAIELCEAAMDGDPEATIGLPSNAHQRAIVIENTLSGILEDECVDGFKKGTNAEEMAKYLVNLSKQLSMRDWVVTNGMELFQKAGHLDVLLKSVVEADPKARFFFYTKAFIDALVERWEGPDLSGFLLSLPKKMAPLGKLLAYANRMNNYSLLAEIYEQKLNNLVSSGRVYVKAIDELPDDQKQDMARKFCHLLLRYISAPSDSDTPEQRRDSRDLIRWLFSVNVEKNGSESFPFLKKVLMCNSDESISVFESVFCFISETKEPFSPTAFANAVLSALSETDYEVNQRILPVLRDILIEYDIKIRPVFLRYLMVNYIFAKNEEDMNKKEALLAAIINSSVPEEYEKEFKDNILPLCESFRFKVIKRQIQLETKMIDQVLKEVVGCRENLFAFLKSLLTSKRYNRKMVEKAILDNCQLIMSNNGDGCDHIGELITLLRNERYKTFLAKMIDHIEDKQFQAYYMYRLLTESKLDAKALSSEMLERLVRFICTNYPDTAYDLIQDIMNKQSDMDKNKIDRPNLLQICEENQIYGMCAYLSRSNPADFCMYVTKEVQTIFMRFLLGDKSMSLETAMTKWGAIQAQISEDVISSQEVMVGLARSIVRTFAVMLWYVQKNHHEVGEKHLPAFLRDFCTYMQNLTPFDQLILMIIEETLPIQVSLVKKVIVDLLKDCSYDIRTKEALAELFHNDEQNLHDAYILHKISGVRLSRLTCGTCKGRLLGSGSRIRIFECQHAFHDTIKCLPKQTCPICNPIERIDDVQPVPHASHIGQSRLRLFEHALSKTGKTAPTAVRAVGSRKISVTRRDVLEVATLTNFDILA